MAVTAASAELKEIHDILQECNISKRVACTQLIENEFFNSLEDFGVMDRDTDFVEMAKRLVSRNIVNRVNLGTVQIQGLQALVLLSIIARHITSR